MDSVLEDVLVELLVDRPFRSVEEMNRHLLRNWRRRGGADDTIICLGLAGRIAYEQNVPLRGLVCAGLNAVFAQHEIAR